MIQDAGHSLQEEKGEEIASHILDFLARTPLETWIRAGGSCDDPLAAIF